MVKRFCLTLLVVALLATGASAADSDRLIVTLKSEKAVKCLKKDYRANVLGQIGSEPIFLIEVDGKYRKKLEKDKKVVETERDQLVSLDQYPEQLSEDGAGYVRLDQSVMSLFGNYGWEDFYGTPVLKDYMDQEPLHMIDADDVHDLSTEPARGSLSSIPVSISTTRPCGPGWSRESTCSEPDRLRNGAAWISR